MIWVVEVYSKGYPEEPHRVVVTQMEETVRELEQKAVGSGLVTHTRHPDTVASTLRFIQGFKP